MLYFCVIRTIRLELFILRNKFDNLWNFLRSKYLILFFLCVFSCFLASLSVWLFSCLHCSACLFACLLACCQPANLPYFLLYSIYFIIPWYVWSQLKFCFSFRHSLHLISDEIYMLSIFKQGCSMTSTLAVNGWVIYGLFMGYLV